VEGLSLVEKLKKGMGFFFSQKRDADVEERVRKFTRSFHKRLRGHSWSDFAKI
jgi:hypothetical protein